MVKMTTFSLTISTKTLARSTIAKIIKVLPEACVNVELVTRDYDESAPKSVHLCDDLRAIPPRLQRLLLCLTAMCPAILMNANGSPQTSTSRLLR